jgi:voltage-gated sodium channel
MIGSLQQSLRMVLNKPWFEKAVLAVIVINAITLGMETSAYLMEQYGTWLKWLDKFILAIFIAEIAARLIVDFKGFWRDPWRIFDFIVVAVALVPTAGPFSVLRAFRILRVLRLISSVKSMRRVVTGLLSALPGMGSIVLLLGLVFYVFSVISTKMFGSEFPDWFGTLGESSYTLFQIMTLESWSMGIVRPVMEAFPYAWLLFIPFIILTAFTVLNLFIGVIVDAMQQEHEAEARSERDALNDQMAQVLEEVRAMRAELSERHKP